MVSSKTERTLWRAFGGVSWLLVSVGTFLVAFGYLGVIDSAFSYYEDPLVNFRMIGYGIVAYAIAAIFVAMNRFVKSHWPVSVSGISLRSEGRTSLSTKGLSTLHSVVTGNNATVRSPSFQVHGASSGVPGLLDIWMTAV